jgi:hypothetical protein
MWLSKKLVAMWIMVVFATPFVLAEVPRIMTYQGRLTDTGGVPYSGARVVVFKIYDGSGTMIWSSGVVTPTFVDGLITVELGKSPQPPLPTANWQTDTLLSLGIALPPDPELTPRYRFTTTGYAFTAKTADLASSIADNTVNSTKIVNGSILFQDLGTNGASEGNVIKMVGGQWAAGTDNTGPSSGWTDAGSIIYNTTLSDNVGIGTTTPGAKLEVVAAGDQKAGKFTSASPNWQFPTLEVRNYGQNTALFYCGGSQSVPVIPSCAIYANADQEAGTAGWFVTNSSHFGAVFADNGADSGMAVDAEAWSGVAASLRGRTGLECTGLGANAAKFASSANELSLVIDAKYTGNSQRDHVAVNGYSKPVDYFGIGGTFEGGYRGVMSSVSPTGNYTYYGITAGVTGGGGTNYGLHTAASGSGTNYGIYSTAYLGATNWAGYFNGDINVTGTVWKSSSGFRIDHPLDPANRYLQHSSVESSEMKNIYDGVAVLDAAGKVTVQLPDWFQAINGGFRYQLTCVGGYAPVYVASEINNNQFEIAGGTPGLKVSWQVTGVRQDKFAQANRLQTEQEKLPTEKGRYLHPELYGLGEEQGVSYDSERTAQDRAKQQALRENLVKAADERIPERPKPQTVKVTER